MFSSIDVLVFADGYGGSSSVCCIDDDSAYDFEQKNETAFRKVFSKVIGIKYTSYRIVFWIFGTSFLWSDGTCKSSLNGWFCSSLSIVLMAIPMLRGIKPVVDRVNGLVDTKTEKRDVCIPSFQTVLEVKNLSFGYEKDTFILKELNLTIRSGEKCALLGKSGSGKTTLIRLLTGELDGYLGQICYDGVELSDTDRETVCNIVSVIHQDVFLFDDTIYNNICLFDTFSKESFEQAVHLSGVSKFIHQFPEGADYRVGQRGEFLSGGQRQRIAIARALIRHTPFLILDEGTSALDEQTAKEIESELINIPDLTLLTITHHLHNPKDYTQVIEL